MPRLEQRLRKVRSSEGTALCDLLHALQGDGVAKPVEVLDHELDAPSAVLAQPAHALLERRVIRINEVRQDMRVAPFRLGVELRRRDHPDAQALALGDRLGDAR